MNGLHSERGIALVVSLAILAVVGALILGSILTTQIELNITRNDSTSAQAQYAAQAGLQKYKAALFQNFRWLENGGATGGTGGGSSTPNTDACHNSLSSGLNFDRAAGGSIGWVNNRITLPAEQVFDVSDAPIGNYEVVILRDPTNESRITIQSVGTTLGTGARQATARATATFIIRNSSTLEQAIFAGAGSGMKFINGNTQIYGGIYIVGDESNAEDVVIQSNGNLGIYNGYSASETGSPNFLVDAVHNAQNLCAALRVEHGKVALGGSTQLGKDSNRLLTVAVSRGAEDVDLEKGLTTECKNNKGICSETAIRPFDIASPPVFPLLDEPPATEFCPAPNTWRSCIRDEAMADGMILTTSGSETVSLQSPAGATLPASCQAALNVAATRSDKLLVFGDGASSSIDCKIDVDGLPYGFRYDGTNGRFEVFGNLNIRGLNLEFLRAVNYRALSRDDTGSNQTFAGLSLEAVGAQGGNFTVQSSFVSDHTSAGFQAGAFPNNVLSLVAEGTVDLSGENKDSYTMPVYAGKDVRVAGGSNLYGQLIADYFCTTNSNHDCSTSGNPANVFFVPTGENRAKSFRAIAPTGGLPTFVVEAYELR